LTVTIHKKREHSAEVKVSLILLDWSCRERFHALDWLNKQDVPRDSYEIIWVELYDRVVPEAMEKADVVITCNQKGMYHKHKGYNVGLLESKGEIITICDSDAVFPPDFIASVIHQFYPAAEASEPRPLVLMHYEQRTKSTYPDGVKTMEEVEEFRWIDLWPNVGACMSVRRADAVRFGAFDEHRSFRGYLCGPYDLGWRLVNAGVPETWHDDSVCLWHFAHPDPPASFGQSFSPKLFAEMLQPHVDHHALKAVEAFSTGRVLPLRENSEVYRERMGSRCIGTAYETRYATITGPRGFSRLDLFKLWLLLLIEPLKALKFLERHISPQLFKRLEKIWRSLALRASGNG
jgi:cellulose synthase/poly-beta-1,6-N-acetylglucosamine synthase-like glycosyltransferase